MTFQPAIYVLMLTQRVQPLVKRRRDLFNGDIELRIQELQAVLSQLGNKVDGLTAFYSATVEEVQREFSEALLRQRQDLETGIQMRVAEHYNTLHQQNNRPEAGFSDIVI